MDRKGIGILVAAVVGFVVYWWAVNKFVPAGERPAPALSQAADAPSMTGGTNGVAAATVIDSNPAPNPPKLSAGAAEQTAVIENNFVRATFTSEGGGLKFVELKKYPGAVDAKAGAGGFATLNRPSFSPAFVLYGGEAVTGDGRFEVTAQGSTVKAVKQFPSGLRVIKTFALTNDYEMSVAVRLENAGSQTVAVPSTEFVVGTASPMDVHEQALSQGVYWFNGSSAKHVDQSWFQNRQFGCIPGRPRHEFRDGSSNVVWTAIHNRFFTMITAPEKPAPSVVVWDYALPAPSEEQKAADGRLEAHPQAHQAGLTYPATSLAAGQTLERKYRVYAGPKEYFTLSRLEPQFDLVMEFTGITGFCAKALLLSLNGLHQFIPYYGLCIVAITVIVKLLFWPLAAASTRSAKRMQAMQPELAAMKEKYKDNPRKFQEKNLELMRKHGVNPATGCIPVLIQIPVFIGFVFMVRTAIELRGEHFLWASDLSQPDTLFMIPGLGFIPIVGIPGQGLPVNLFPLLMVSTSLWLSHLTPPSPQMDPAQQKMMRYMPVFFVVFFYSYPAGLTLYWTVQNLLSVLQTKVTRAGDVKKPQPAAPARIAGRK
jgi:YidC/Oxa1 family membrane protein insertase